jgi:hypothetical protein
VDFLARLTALIPAPHVNMVRYHGVFAPASPLRWQVVPRGVAECRHRALHGGVGPGAEEAGERGGDRDDRGGRGGRERGEEQAGCGAAERQPGRNDNASTSEAAWRLQETGLRYLMGTLPADKTSPPPRARRLDWAALLARVWSIDVLECPRCHGRMRVIAALSEAAVVSKVLAHLGLPTTLPQPAPARAPPWFEEDLDQGALDFDFDAELDQRAL